MLNPYAATVSPDAGNLTRLCWFFAVLVVIVPLVLHPKTAGPLVEYTGFAVLLTVVSAIIAASALRRYTPSAGSPRRLQPAQLVCKDSIAIDHVTAEPLD